MSDTIVAMLNELAGLQAAQDAIRLAKEDAVERAIPAELRNAVAEYKKLQAEVEAEFSGKAEEAASKAADLEKAVKKAVVEFGDNVRGDYLHAVYNKGRVSWNTDKLDGYLKAHPELAEFRKQGEPSVALRKA